MALSATNSDGKVTVSSQTASDHISLVPGREYALSFSSAGAFALDLQMMAGDGASWDDVYDVTDKVSIDSTTGKQNVRVPAGNYRMNVTTYNNPITMWAREL
jgi:hypothetical protein